MIEHDVQAGKLDHCQVCGSNDLELILDLGHQPLCDSLLDKSGLNQPETHYPLRLFRCLRCSLAQLDYVVDGSVVYYPGYPYRSGITRELAAYQRAFANEAVKKINPERGSLCVDIGSNDGTLLTGFRDNGMRVLGIEPTDIAMIAGKENGIETIQAFFTEDLAASITSEYGHAGIITATNVFAHMASLGEVIRGILRLLDNRGIFITESHYLLDVLQRTQYDTIYHEHIRTYSLKSLIALFRYYELEIFDVQRTSRYGGNIRAYICRRGKFPVHENVKLLLEEEQAGGLYASPLYRTFRDRVYKSRDELMDIALKSKKDGLCFVGNSCPGRCSTLLNFCGIGPCLMPYIAEQSTSLKLGRYLPGLHIPVVDNSILFTEQPDLVVLLAWHYAEPISGQLRERGLNSTFIVPLPEVRMIKKTNP
jgi:SAM-dependent methyltransferase